MVHGAQDGTLPLPPIIKRGDSPSSSSSPVPLRSPQFVSSPPSPLSPTSSHFFSPTPSLSALAQPTPSQGGAGGGGHYFAPQHGILLNKGETPGVTSTSHTPRIPSPSILHSPQPEKHNAGLAVLRVSSSDSGSATSESAFSPVTVSPPSSAAGSPPPTVGKPILSTLLSFPSPSNATDTPRTQSPPSPHCHFAPLPKVDNDRPGTRRNSFANRVKPYRAPPERSDSMASSTGGFDTDTDDLHSPTIHSPQSGVGSSIHFGDSSIPTASALSQRLSSSLTFAAPHPSSSSHSPSRPTSRRSSSSRRSRSPSPPPPGGSAVSRSSSRGGAVGVGAVYAAHNAASRSHSPNLSRHASTDALSLHYIEGGAERSGGATLSRTSSRAGSERDGGITGRDGEGPRGEDGPLFAHLGAGRRIASSSRDRSTASPFFPSSTTPSYAAAATSAGLDVPPTTTTTSSSSSTSATIGGVRDRDKEADLHRLEKKASEGNEDAARAVSPALAMAAAQAARERSVSRGERTGEEVVVVGAPREEGDEGMGGELEEVQEEEEEEEEENEEEEDEEEDEDEGSDEEGSAEESAEEGDVSREKEDGEDDEDDEDEEEEQEEERKTSKGAAVEVVRWHRPERDLEEQHHAPIPAPPATNSALLSPSLNLPTPSGTPTIPRRTSLAPAVPDIA